MEKIKISELIERLDKAETDPDEIEGFFVENDEGRTSMAPTFSFNPETVDLGEAEEQGVVPEAAILGWSTRLLNRYWRAKRQREFERKVAAGYSGVRLVAEGDSWFQYPLRRTDDLIDFITPHYAIYCLSAAGDEFENMTSAKNRRLISDTIRNTEAHGLLFSGGGNDIAGPELVSFLQSPSRASAANDFISESFNRKLEQMERTYIDFFEALWVDNPELKIFFHGYDHAIPRDGGRWIGGPLARMGTINRQFWAAIIKEMIDRYNVVLTRLSDRFQGRLFHADCRTMVGTQENWRDELHARQPGCERAAGQFLSLLQREFSSIAPETHLSVPEFDIESENAAEASGKAPDESDEYGDLDSETKLLPGELVTLEESRVALPESFAETAMLESSVIPTVSWPRHDANSPDYAHFSPPQRGTRFELTADVIEKLIALNGFQPVFANDQVVFGLRGARLVTGHEAHGGSVALIDQRPNHATPQCVVGVYNRSNKTVLALTGSTVPNGRNMIKHWKRANGVAPGSTKANMLPTGSYRYRRGSHGWSNSHRRWKVPIALRLTARSGGNDGAATVLRSNNDATYGTLDEYDLSMPHDNIHCAFGTTSFSSAGCITIRGTNARFAKRGTLQWNTFQNFITTMEVGQIVDCLILTGAEAALVARQDDADLRRLRTGSQGDAVKRLQAFLGTSTDGDFGPRTKQRYTMWQRSVAPGGAANGIYTPADDLVTGQPILGAPPQ